eukprot:CAMPEP_0183419096 /NCGR_PEP_ID=MMETSP0370-20130417/25556_1 /TAXON_ID=268820 /ORGANISM="Peridinium aciculiferum, Strain PAER-2" /LENGTH=133 /DNA_ID=CAMNT_0025602869 /DNA_START=482 /DNA_END=879 /DNA_ORIENTATION=-
MDFPSSWPMSNSTMSRLPCCAAQCIGRAEKVVRSEPTVRSQIPLKSNNAIKTSNTSSGMSSTADLINNRRNSSWQSWMAKSKSWRCSSTDFLSCACAIAFAAATSPLKEPNMSTTAATRDTNGKRPRLANRVR